MIFTGIKYRTGLAGRVYGHFTRSIFYANEKIPPEGRILSAFFSAVCLVGLRFDSHAHDPMGD